MLHGDPGDDAVVMMMMPYCFSGVGGLQLYALGLVWWPEVRIRGEEDGRKTHLEFHKLP